MESTHEQGARAPGPEGVIGFARSLWFAGIGTAFTAAAGAHMVFKAMSEEGEKITRRERPDVERALITASDRVKEAGERVEAAVEETMSSGLRRFGVPTREEVRKLALRIEQLTAQLEAHGLER